MLHRLQWLSGTAALMVILNSSTARAATAVITPIDVPTSSSFLTLVDLSSDGSVVTGTTHSSTGTQAFRWSRQTGVVPLPQLSPRHTRNIGSGVSDDGSVLVGTATLDTGTEIDAFYWTTVDGTAGIGGVNDGVSTHAFNVSGDGSTVVGARDAPDNNPATSAFRWRSVGGFEYLGDLPGGDDHSIALGASFDGKAVIGVSQSASGLEAFLWREAEGIIGLGDLPGGEYASGASDVSHNGRVVVGNSVVAGFNRAEHQQRAFRWTNQTGLVDLGLLPDAGTALPSSFASGVTADGNTAVGRATSTRNQGAFLWTETAGMRSLWDVLRMDYGLDLSDWQLRSAEGISADGTVIIGTGMYKGVSQPWHVELVSIPEPSGFVLVAASWLVVRRRRSS